MAKKKIYNINALRPVIVCAHGAEYCNSKAMKESAKDEPAFLAFIDRMIKGVEEQEKANEESRTKANEALAKVSKDAKAIEAKIKEIK